jgi:HSP20 family molecular chaperone IbpA
MPPQLPENAELTGITARFENGVLTVRVPKAIPVEPEVTEIPIADGDDNTIDI